MRWQLGNPERACALTDQTRTRAEGKPTGKSNQSQHRKADIFLGGDPERKHLHDLPMTIERGVS